MTEKKQTQEAPAAPTTEDVLDRQYHAIGIGAVAAACRYLHDPVEPRTDADIHADDAKTH
jgi:hypothetical protein